MIIKRAIVIAVVLALLVPVTSHAKKKLPPTWIVNAFMCIHSHEGAWNANTGNGYYGGLQMNKDYMYAYGREYLRRWGYAHNWPIWAQLDAGYRGWRDRGFRPWPNTARMCGLL